MALRTIFAGTPDFAVPSLRAVIDAGHQVAAVFTQPDRPSGRGRRMLPSPVKRLAAERGLEVRQPQRLRAAIETLRALQPDVIVVVAYGQLLSEQVLAVPRLGCVNVHASLLPRWRGAAPIQRAIEAGDADTGVTIMLMDAGLDTGPMLRQAAMPIGGEDTAGSLHDRLAASGAVELVAALGELERGSARPRPQPDEGVTYARKVDPAEAAIDWGEDAEAVARRVRAFDPWPVCFTRWRGARLRVWRAAAAAQAGDAPPGTVLAAGADGIVVRCGQGALRLNEVQAEGGRRVSVRDFLNGHDLSVGERLGARANP
jgi:methionyl-tRNA formyltransferase